MEKEMDLRHAHVWRRKKEARKLAFTVLTFVVSAMAACGYTALFCR